VSTISADPSAPAVPERRYRPCEQCGAPLDDKQRYCVNCAARRPDVDNPAARYLATATRRGRPVAAPATGSSSAVRGAAVVFFLLLPLAVAIGILVGRSGGGGNSTDTAKVLAALRHARGPLASTGAATGAAPGGGTALASQSSGSGTIASDFSLDKGYTVSLQTLPASSTDQAAVDSAKKSAEGKGAKQVGIISPHDFTTTPDLGSQNYILYSGEYKQKAQAEAALKKLKPKFPSAQVIAVKSATSGGGSTAAGANAGGKVTSHTSIGTTHQVTGIKPTKQDQQQGAQIAQHVASQIGHDYIGSQQGLPDVIAVGGSPSSAPPQSTGPGQP
jgi:hypothetical protein